MQTLVTQHKEWESNDNDETGQVHESPLHAAHSPLSRRVKLKQQNPENTSVSKKLIKYGQPYIV